MVAKRSTRVGDIHSTLASADLSTSRASIVSVAVTVALRGAPVSNDISPSIPPAPSVATAPSSSATVTSASPLTITNIEWPGPSSSISLVPLSKTTVRAWSERIFNSDSSSTSEKKGVSFSISYASMLVSTSPGACRATVVRRLWIVKAPVADFGFWRREIAG